MWANKPLIFENNFYNKVEYLVIFNYYKGSIPDKFSQTFCIDDEI